jgi:hypothetical protein
MATFDPFGYGDDFNHVLKAINKLSDKLDLIQQAVSASLAAVSIEIASVAAGQSAQGANLASIRTNTETIMASLDDVLADVTAETSAIDSLSTLIQGLRDQIANAGLSPADQAKVDAIFAGAESNKAALAAALAANVPTPAA